VREAYTLTPVQADAILRMTLSQLVNLEQERLGNEYQELLKEIAEYQRILADDANILAIIRDDLVELKRKHSDKRRTEISGEEIGSIDMGDLITEENMVVTISHQGYIKRTAASTYRAQRRGGKGLKGAKTEDEDPIRHLFAASTHDYLLFFTNRGRVYWQKVYDLPQLSRESRGRAIVNLLHLAEGETIADCRAVRDFTQPDHYLLMATRRGLVKKTPLSQYGRPQRNGIIAIKLKENDELVDVVVARAGDEVVLSTARGMAIRFRQSDARPMGRNSSGVKGIKLTAGDELVGMVVADPEATLLTVCLNGYGKRTDFGPNSAAVEEEPTSEVPADDDDGEEEPLGAAEAGRAGSVSPLLVEPGEEDEDESGEEAGSSSRRYRTQRRGGKGLRDIKATERNGPVVSIVSVRDDDELLMMTARGKIQRIVAGEISSIGRNTQGVKIMSLDEGDTLAAAVRVPRVEGGEEVVQAAEPAQETPTDGPPEAQE
jgi:DNA gyrase subunit A